MTDKTNTGNAEIAYTADVTQSVSINTFLEVDMNGEILKIQLTTRHGAKPQAIVQDFLNHLEALQTIRKERPAPSYQRANAAVAKAEKSEPPAAPGASAEKKFSPRRAENLPDWLSPDLEYYEERFDYFVIRPELEDKASVEFRRDKLDYPVISINKWKAGTLAEALREFGAVDTGKPNKVVKQGRVVYKQGAEFTIKQGKNAGKTSHYKDVVYVQANEPVTADTIDYEPAGVNNNDEFVY